MGDTNNTVTTNTETTGQTQVVTTNSSETNIDSAIERGTEQKTNAILKSYFKQQGMEESEIQEAIKNWKEAKEKEKIEKENAIKEAEAKKDQAVRDAEAKAEAAMNLLKQEKINNAVKDAAITLGVNPERIGLFSKLIDTTNIQIDENYNVDSESIKKAISDVLEMAPEFKKSPETVTGFKFGATKTETTEPKNTKNLTLRESLALRYNS